MAVAIAVAVAVAVVAVAVAMAASPQVAVVEAARSAARRPPTARSACLHQLLYQQGVDFYQLV
mgnify:CR=1 FL=1